MFVPGLQHPAAIAELVGGLPAPLSLLVTPASPPLAELARLGVARISVG